MEATRERYINLSLLRQQTKSDPGLLVELIGIYLDQTPALVHDMKNGVETKDWQLVQAAAHKLKPSFQIMGIGGNQERKAMEIEDLAKRKGPEPQVRALIDDIAGICDIVYTELQEDLLDLEKARQAKG